MKALAFAWLVLILRVFASDAMAQGGCMRAASAYGSMGSMMSPMSGSFNPANYQATLFAQTQLAYQYQLQQTQLQQQLQLEQTALQLQSEQAARKAAYASSAWPPAANDRSRTKPAALPQRPGP